MAPASAISNIEEFAKTVRRIAVELPEEAIYDFHVKVGFAALDGVVYKTPVDEGTHRANWHVTIHTKSTKFDPSKTDKQGDSTIEAGRAVIQSLIPFVDIYLNNAAPAILVLEDGLFDPADPGPSKDKRPDREGEILVKGGYSLQAPAGMVDVTLEELATMFG